MALDVRLTLRTDDDALVHMTYGRPLEHPGLSCGRTIAGPRQAIRDRPSLLLLPHRPRCSRQGAKRYAWLNDIVCVGSGYLIEGGIAYKVSEVL